MPRVLIMAPPELVSELNRTILWRRDVERVFGTAGDERPLDTIHSTQPDLVILGHEDPAVTQEALRQIRTDPRTRAVSVGVVRGSVTLEEEEQLRRAGANVVFGGAVVPYLWDAWLEELLSVPRRREARVPVMIAVWSHSAPGSDAATGMGINISVKGMLIETFEPLEVGAKVDLSFALPGVGPVRAVAQVIREDVPEDGRPSRLGVEFLILREGGRDRIRTFVDSVEGA